MGKDWSFPAINRADDSEFTYTPIPTDQITKTWKTCVLFPHMKDPFWVSANYGTLIEAQRDNMDYNLFEAGGYPNVDKQISQLQDCTNGGYDAIVVGAVNATALCPQIEAALAKGIVVVDLINGVNCPKAEDSELFAHTAVSYKTVSATAAQWLVDKVGATGANVGVYPGPEGAGWSDDVLAGWTETTKGTPVVTVDTRRGDYGVDIQQGLIQDSITANPTINWIYGLTAAVEGGLAYLRGANRTDVQVLSGNPDPTVYQAIVDGQVAASGLDFSVMQSRMGMDSAARLLEKKLENKNVGPKPGILTKDNMADYPYDLLFGPKDFQPTYTWAPAS